LKRKRLITVVGSLCLVLVLAALLLPACTPEEEVPVGPTTAAPTTASPTTASPTPAQPAKTYDFKYQQWRLPSEVAMQYYVEMLEEQLPILTDGRVKMKLYWSGDLVKSTDIFEAVSTGMIQMAGWPCIYGMGILPEAGIEYGLPFGLREQGERYDFLYGRGLPNLWKGFRAIDIYEGLYNEQNIHIISEGVDFWTSSFMSTKPITKASDMEGIKIRCSGLMMEWAEKMGGEATFIPGEEIYGALSTGVLDMLSWGGACSMYLMGFADVCKYLDYPPLMQTSHGTMIANLDTWSELPPDLQGIITLAFLQAGRQFTQHQNLTGDPWSIKMMTEDMGVTFCELTGTELAIAEDAGLEVWDEHAAASPTAALLVDMIKEYMELMGYSIGTAGL